MKLKQENVWDYPRPAIYQKHIGLIEVIINNNTIARSNKAFRVIETSHPPTYYFPPEDVKMNFLKKNKNSSFCEWKGEASYFDLSLNKENKDKNKSRDDIDSLDKKNEDNQEQNKDQQKKMK